MAFSKAMVRAAMSVVSIASIGAHQIDALKFTLRLSMESEQDSPYTSLPRPSDSLEAFYSLEAFSETLKSDQDTILHGKSPCRGGFIVTISLPPLEISTKVTPQILMEGLFVDVFNRMSPSNWPALIQNKKNVGVTMFRTREKFNQQFMNKAEAEQYGALIEVDIYEYTKIFKDSDIIPRVIEEMRKIIEVSRSWIDGNPNPYSKVKLKYYDSNEW